MFQRSIRGAITVLKDSEIEISSATVELLNEMINENNIKTTDISNVVFTMTDDLKSVYPAKSAREHIDGFNKVPMMCVQELKIDNSLKMCIRVLMTVNTEKKQDEIKHIYLRDAKKLRVDL